MRVASFVRLTAGLAMCLAACRCEPDGPIPADAEPAAEVAPVEPTPAPDAAEAAAIPAVIPEAPAVRPEPPIAGPVDARMDSKAPTDPPPPSLRTLPPAVVRAVQHGTANKLPLPHLAPVRERFKHLAPHAGGQGSEQKDPAQ